jgi:septal ring factor EnvC (AmiA/AmiB activator)
MSYYKVQDNPGLVRDSNNNSILNIDQNAIKRHQYVMSQKERQQKVESEINTIKQDISELKDMIRAALIKE